MFPFLNNNFKIFFIGGKQIYEQFIPLCDTLWVTTIKTNYFCDLFLKYDYTKYFKDFDIEEDEELKIVKWSKSP